jgi:hypothetical protein
MPSQACAIPSLVRAIGDGRWQFLASDSLDLTWPAELILRPLQRLRSLAMFAAILSQKEKPRSGEPGLHFLEGAWRGGLGWHPPSSALMLT